MNQEFDFEPDDLHLKIRQQVVDFYNVNTNEQDPHLERNLRIIRGIEELEAVGMTFTGFSLLSDEAVAIIHGEMPEYPEVPVQALIALTEQQRLIQSYMHVSSLSVLLPDPDTEDLSPFFARVLYGSGSVDELGIENPFDGRVIIQERANGSDPAFRLSFLEETNEKIDSDPLIAIDDPWADVTLDWMSDGEDSFDANEQKDYIIALAARRGIKVLKIGPRVSIIGAQIETTLVATEWTVLPAQQTS